MQPLPVELGFCLSQLHVTDNKVQTKSLSIGLGLFEFVQLGMVQ